MSTVEPVGPGSVGDGGRPGAGVFCVLGGGEGVFGGAVGIGVWDRTGG